MKRTPWNKIGWTKEMDQFLQDHFDEMTNAELAKELGLKLTSVRTRLYSLGLKRQEMEYWTDEQIEFLKENYQKIGDTEMADIFELKWHKAKGWTKKHIEKKRRYLKLKRNKQELESIRERNRQKGDWRISAKYARSLRITHPIAELNERRVWFRVDGSPIAVIKTVNGMEHLHRYLWEKHKGKVPKGMNVVIIDDNRLDFTIEDLVLMTDAELATHNSKRRTPPELRETMKLIKNINRKIYKDEQHSRTK